jgi:hypothetical protein
LNDDFKFQDPREEMVSNLDSNPTTDRLIDLVEQTRSNLLRTQRRIERTERQYDSLMRHILALWLFVGLVAVGGAGLSWYEFSNLSRQTQTGQILLQSPNGAGKTESAGNVAADPGKYASSVNRDISPPPSPSPPSAVPAPAVNPVHSEIDANPVAHSNQSQQTSGKRNKQADISKIDKLSDGVQRHRVDFAVSSKRTQEISPGLYLTINETNVRQQVVDGWLQITADSHTVRILGQEAEKVLIFGMKKDPRPIALVFTQVESNKVSGYLMVPPADPGA